MECLTGRKSGRRRVWHGDDVALLQSLGWVILFALFETQASVAYCPLARASVGRLLDLNTAPQFVRERGRSRLSLICTNNCRIGGVLKASRGCSSLGEFCTVLGARRRNRGRREMYVEGEVVVEPRTATLTDGNPVSLSLVEKDSADFLQVLDLFEKEAHEKDGEFPFNIAQDVKDAGQHVSVLAVGSARLGDSPVGDIVGGCIALPKDGWKGEGHTCELVIVVAKTNRRRGIATALAQWMCEILPRFGFETVISFRTFACNKAGLQLLRGLDFKYIGVHPRAAYFPGTRGAVDAFLFFKDIRYKGQQQDGPRGKGEELQSGGGSTLEDETWMIEAEQEAISAGNKGEVPVGAVIVRDGIILGRGRNGVITHSDPSWHAEMQAIRQAASQCGNYRLNGCTLYVTLEPCAMCAGTIIHSRLSRVVYGARDAKAGCAGSVLDLLQNGKFNHVVQVTSGVREEETSKILSDFFALRRKKNESSEDVLDRKYETRS